MANDPEAFLSYTRIDDEFFGGSISSLRAALQLGVQVVTGNRDFRIFQDIDGIELGQQWQIWIEEAISRTRFLIPVITPLFFTSEACRDELSKFLAHERSLGRSDLILPIYFVTTPALEKADQLAQDPLAKEIRKRNYRDWRKAADLRVDDPTLRQEVRQLAVQIAGASERFSGAQNKPASPEDLVIGPLSAPHPPNRRLELKKILWGDDRPANNSGEREAMKRYGIIFVLAKSTNEALSEIAKPENEFDAIISDMGRPPDYQAGYTLLRAVRSTGNQIPYFIYAGSNAPEHRNEAIQNGAQGSTNVATELMAMVMDAIR